MNNSVSILSTVLLSTPLIEGAKKHGMDIDVLPFIRIAFVDNKELTDELYELATLPITAVFTSANAVKAVAAILATATAEWTVYCIGHATKEAALQLLHNAVIKGMGKDAATLANVIVEDDVLEVVFFCGDKRMDTLPDLLRAEEISVHEMVVYNTIETPQPVTKSYDGMLFFSPLGVNSFFEANTPSPNTVLFAVGNTTAAALKGRSTNKIIISETPSKEQVVQDAAAYFNKQAIAR